MINRIEAERSFIQTPERAGVDRIAPVVTFPGTKPAEQPPEPFAAIKLAHEISLRIALDYVPEHGITVFEPKPTVNHRTGKAVSPLARHEEAIRDNRRNLAAINRGLATLNSLKSRGQVSSEDYKATRGKIIEGRHLYEIQQFRAKMELRAQKRAMSGLR